jgi:hypothetical protein
MSKQSRPASEMLHSAFTWPPADEELSPYTVRALPREAELSGTDITTAEPLVAPASLAVQAPSVVPRETQANLPAAAIGQKVPDADGPVRVTMPASSEPRDATLDWRPVGDALTRSEGQNPKPSGIEDSTSGNAVGQSEPALHGTSGGETATEIAHLHAEIAHVQALIEGLTQKFARSTQGHVSGSLPDRLASLTSSLTV